MAAVVALFGQSTRNDALEPPAREAIHAVISSSRRAAEIFPRLRRLANRPLYATIERHPGKSSY